MVDSYSTKIPREIADLFQKYIDKNPELGYRKVSQYILYVLQEEVKRLIERNLEIREQKKETVTLREGTYTQDDLLKLLEKIKE